VPFRSVWNKSLPKPEVVYLIQNPPNERDFARFGIDFMVEKGLETLVLDVTKLSFPDISIPFDVHYNPKCATIKISSYKDLFAFKDTLEGAKIIFSLVQAHGHGLYNYRMFRLLSRLSTPYLILSCYQYPGWDVDWTKRTFLKKIKDAIADFQDKDILNSFVASIPARMLGIGSADYVVFGGRDSDLPNTLIDEKTKAIYAHNFDYDLYLKAKEVGGDIVPGATAVFLDQYSPFHQDLLQYGNLHKLNPKNYYDDLNYLFDRVEEKFNIEVVIAAHPRADYSDKPFAYRHRKIIYHKTADLIMNSELVIAHDSLSIAFAVLFNKPLLLVAYKARYELNILASYVYHAFEKALKKKYQFIEDRDRVDISSAMELDQLVYDNYVEKYIKIPGSRKQLFWQIVLDKLVEDGVMR
jgi:hypothetical protein